MKKTLFLVLISLMILNACSKHDDLNIDNKENIIDNSNEEKEKEIEETINESYEIEKYYLKDNIIEKLVIDTDNEVLIYLDNVNAKLDDSIIKIKNAKQATIIFEGDNILETTSIDTKLSVVMSI